MEHAGFPVVDFESTLIDCVRKIKGKPAVVVKDGRVIGLLIFRELLNGFLNGKQKVKELKLITKQDFLLLLSQTA